MCIVLCRSRQSSSSSGSRWAHHLGNPLRKNIQNKKQRLAAFKSFTCQRRASPPITVTSGSSSPPITVRFSLLPATLAGAPHRESVTLALVQPQFQFLLFFWVRGGGGQVCFGLSSFFRVSFAQRPQTNFLETFVPPCVPLHAGLDWTHNIHTIYTQYTHRHLKAETQEGRMGGSRRGLREGHKMEWNHLESTSLGSVHCAI